MPGGDGVGRARQNWLKREYPKWVRKHRCDRFGVVFDAKLERDEIDTNEQRAGTRDIGQNAAYTRLNMLVFDASNTEYKRI